MSHSCGGCRYWRGFRAAGTRGAFRLASFRNVVPVHIARRTWAIISQNFIGAAGKDLASLTRLVISISTIIAGSDAGGSCSSARNICRRSGCMSQAFGCYFYRLLCWRWNARANCNDIQQSINNDTSMFLVVDMVPNIHDSL